MSEKPKELKTVLDVLEWAFDYLGIECLCDEETCGCDANQVRECEYALGCNLARKQPCTQKHEYCDRCEFGPDDEIDTSGLAETCHIPKTYAVGTCFASKACMVPVSQQWTTDPPTEPGIYAMIGPDDIPIIFQAVDVGGKMHALIGTKTIVPFPENADACGNKWLKIEKPE